MTKSYAVTGCTRNNRVLSWIDHQIYTFVLFSAFSFQWFCYIHWGRSNPIPICKNIFTIIFIDNTYFTNIVYLNNFLCQDIIVILLQMHKKAQTVQCNIHDDTSWTLRWQCCPSIRNKKMSKLRSIYGMGLRNTTAMHPMEAGINGRIFSVIRIFQ